MRAVIENRFSDTRYSTAMDIMSAYEDITVWYIVRASISEPNLRIFRMTKNIINEELNAAR